MDKRVDMESAHRVTCNTLIEEGAFPADDDVQFLGKDAYVARLVAANVKLPKPGRDTTSDVPGQLRRARPGLDELLK